LHYKSNHEVYFSENFSRDARLCFITVTQTQATIQTVAFDYLPVTISELSLTYVTDSVEESLLR
jgi:hypothetical protein